MPSFREKMINKLRTPEQGADTLVWMCCFKDLEKNDNGAFFQGIYLFCFLGLLTDFIFLF